MQMLRLKAFCALCLLLLFGARCGGKPLVVVMFESDAEAGDFLRPRLLERTDSCRTVTISISSASLGPAGPVCGPGLVCNPNTGTCVPVGSHPGSRQPSEIPHSVSKILQTLGRDDELQKTPWL